jgi:hypothetical protein
MDKIELERMLADPEGAQKILEVANAIKKKHGDAVGDVPSSKPREILRPEGMRPSPEEALASDTDHVEVKHLLADMGRLVPAVRGRNAKESLPMLTDQCRSNPSRRNRFLLEDGINRIVSEGELDSESSQVVGEALKTLGYGEHSIKPSESAMKRGGGNSICAWLWEHPDGRGRSLYLNHGSGETYRRMALMPQWFGGLGNCISSAALGVTGEEEGGRVILFDGYAYGGRYATFAADGGQVVSIPHVGTFIDNRTSSVLVVREYAGEIGPFALGDFGMRERVDQFISDQSRVRVRGDVTVTWDMWPSFYRSRRFVYLEIPVKFIVPYWFDYDGKIRYWIYLYIDVEGNLCGHTQYYDAWVEGGMKHDEIYRNLLQRLPDTGVEIDKILETDLTLLNSGGPFERQYFLPGTARDHGRTGDDVSLVLVPQ